MGLWNWLKSLFGQRDADEREDDGKPLISLVLLLREPRYLDDDLLRQMVNKAWDIDLDGDDPDATDFVIGESPAFIIQYKGRNFLVNNFAMPYVENVEEVAESINELRRRKAFAEHTAWLSVDLLGDAKGPEDLAKAYRRIGKLVAALADGDCLAILSPATNELIPYDAELDEKLRGENVLEEVFSTPGEVPVVPIRGDDPRMKAAEKEARRRFPEFVAAYKKRTPEQNFAVKFPFEDGEIVEFMWVSVTGIDGDLVSGRIDNEPLDVGTVKLGSRVRVSAKKLNDWIYTDGDDMQGGFTIKAIEEIQRDRQ